MTSISRHPLDQRTTALPIGRPAWWELYEKMQRLIWFSWDINYSREYESFASLDPARQKVVKNILGFFANSDKLVNDNIEERFSKEIDIYEAKCIYTLQEHMENVHNTTYSLLLHAIILDDSARTYILGASTNIPVVKAMADWIVGTTKSSEIFASRVLKMVMVEGVMFVSAFCYIYWLASEGKMPGLAHSNELIQRDELMHAAWGAEVYRACTIRPSRSELVKIVGEAVGLAADFARETLGEDSRLSADSMCRYIEKKADDMLLLCGEEKIYGSRCEFDFMIMAEMKNQTDFFHRQPSEYTMTNGPDSGGVNIDI
jgi:ribonucleoside-diphosphate reductase subunit M2